MAGLRLSGRPKLIEPTEFGSPARAELGVAIARRNAMRAAHAQVSEAETGFWRRSSLADQAVQAAKAALEAARASAANAIVLGAEAENHGVKEARAALVAAEDEVVTLAAAKKLFKPRMEAAERETSLAESAVKRAASLVLREHVICIVDRIENLEKEYLKLAGAFANLVGHSIFVDQNDWGASQDTWLRKRSERLAMHVNQPPNQWSFPIEGAIQWGSASDVPARTFVSAGAAPWEVAYNALQTDANAPLPELPK